MKNKIDEGKKYIGGSVILGIGNALAIIGIILGIGLFVEYNAYMLIASLTLIISGIAISIVGVSIRGPRYARDEYINH